LKITPPERAEVRTKDQEISFSQISRIGIISGQNIKSQKLFLIKFYMKKVSGKIFVQLKITPQERTEVRTLRACSFCVLKLKRR